MTYMSMILEQIRLIQARLDEINDVVFMFSEEYTPEVEEENKRLKRDLKELSREL